MPTVSISGEDQKFEVKENQTIFDALDNHGYVLPHGCLSGSCGACRVEVQEGSENLKEAGTIEKDTIKAIKENYIRIHGRDALEGKTVRLACRAKILGDLVIKPLR
jgi:ferredoxin